MDIILSISHKNLENFAKKIWSRDSFSIKLKNDPFQTPNLYTGLKGIQSFWALPHQQYLSVSPNGDPGNN